ncbi:hypothetical protein KIW84_062542 [Lathyrus oleraceus]|uniref:Reverse transcriptase RNase H-like domain-containing protein n=1 Tax=Pisum sativum TaxID=3888 RepID=A0A9D4W958_PEA|nr:hypothetical protein KIW84_062542 [Pisum sativum]
MDPIKYIFEKPALTGRIARWQMLLSEYDIEYQSQKAIKEPGSHWGMVFDGAVNQYGNGIGAVIITPQGTHFSFTARLTFKCTNNMAQVRRIAKQVNNRTPNVLNDASYPCSLIQDESRPSIVVARPPIPAPLLKNLPFFKPSARLISNTTNRTRILHFNITKSATRLMKTSSSQSPSLS